MLKNWEPQEQFSRCACTRIRQCHSYKHCRRDRTPPETGLIDGYLLRKGMFTIQLRNAVRRLIPSHWILYQFTFIELFVVLLVYRDCIIMIALRSVKWIISIWLNSDVHVSAISTFRRINCTVIGYISAHLKCQTICLVAHAEHIMHACGRKRSVPFPIDGTQTMRREIDRV